jgi:hypothetical protein
MQKWIKIKNELKNNGKMYIKMKQKRNLGNKMNFHKKKQIFNR